MQGEYSIPTRHGSVAVSTAGKGTPVLLIHGIPGSGEVWKDVVGLLVEEGYHVIVPDLLGFRRSSRPVGIGGLWVDAQAEAMLEILRACASGSAIVVGHDYGAPIAVTLTRNAPDQVRALVLAAGNLFTDTPVPAPLRAVTMPFLGKAVGRLVFSGPALRLMLKAGCGRPYRRLDSSAYLGDARQQAAIRSIFMAALQELHIRYAPIASALPHIRKPTVVLWGTRDPFFPVSIGHRAANAILNSRLHIAPGAGHFLPNERPADFAEAVRSAAAGGVEVAPPISVNEAP